MTIERYIEGALRTESHRNPITKEVEDLGLSGRLAHVIIGISTEVNEVNFAIMKKLKLQDIQCLQNVTRREIDVVNLMEEIGDIKWYLAIASDILPDFTIKVSAFDRSIELRELLFTLNEHAGKMLDLMKKTMFYGKPLDIKDIINSLNHIDVTCDLIVQHFGKSPKDVLATNLAKLSARYPEKFTDFDADNRDLKKERTILEEGVNK